MESSFFEYRDKTGVESDSDTEIIDESIMEESFILTTKTPLKKNHTIIPDSGESAGDDESDEDQVKSPETRSPKTIVRKSIVVCSSDDGASEQGSRAQSQNMSYNNVETNSSDEDDGSPELVPKRRPARLKSLNSTTDSPIVRKVKKRIMQLESDTDNSIIIERNKNTKMKCLKDTPLKIDCGRDGKVNDSEESDDIDDESDSDKGNDRLDNVETDNGENYASANINEASDVDSRASDDIDKASDGVPASDNAEDASDGGDETDDGPDEDQMTMSRATRMSIMGIIPKQNESDESDFIESDDNEKIHFPIVPDLTTDNPTSKTAPKLKAPLEFSSLEPSRTPNPTSFQTKNAYELKNTRPPVLSVKRSSVGSTESFTDLPEVNLTSRTPMKLNSPEKPKTPERTEPRNNDSALTCSPIASPLQEKTLVLNNSKSDSPVLGKKVTPRSKEKNALKDRVLRRLIASDASDKENSNADDDDEVTVIESSPEVITLSSDEDDEMNPPKKAGNAKKSPNIKKSPKDKGDTSTARKDNTIRQYLPPPSYPNQVVYVQKHVLDNELSKLNGLQADLHNIRNLLENMDVTTLPDGGSKLIMRLTELEQKVRQQGDRVGNMVVEPAAPAVPAASALAPDGLSWNDIQKASNAVQPRMFGKQAMSTHLAERNLILERLRDLHESLDSRPPEDQLATAPAAMKTELMPHQLHALAWLRWRETQRPAGGILADDMGLGKTITMISLVASDKELQDDEDEDDDDDDDRPRGKLVRGGTLVVCPASLLAQWAEEVSKHARPHRVTTSLHHGAARASQPQRLAAADMVITTYNLLQRDSEKNGVLMRVRWRRVILDEGHIVRNHKSVTSQAVCGLRARRRWALTGTPVHNKDLDLFALLKFLRCTPFDDLTMWKKWIDNKSAGGQERLSTIMRCVLLRRTKAQLQARGQLAGLPPRRLHQRPVVLSAQETDVYQKVLVLSKTLFAQFLYQRAEKQADGVGFVSRGQDAYHQMHKKMIALQGAKPVKSHEILVLLLRLRQVCCHCGLIGAMLDAADAADDADGDARADQAGRDLLAELNRLSLHDATGKSGEEEKEEEVPEEEGTTVAEAIRSVMSPNNPVFQLDRRSSKIQAVMDCLRDSVFPNKGEKAVVVSQWTSVLRLVEKELQKEKVRCVTLSGAVAVPARAALVAALNDPNSDVRVMLLSLCAGGVGLNLCGASHLLLLDPHWNPQLEQQAQDRVYRVGQTRPVHVHRFMCVDTVEQSIRKLQDAKLELAENVLTGARHTHASKLSIEDLKVLFNMGQ